MEAVKRILEYGAIKQAEQNRRREIADDLKRRRRLGVDTFAVLLFDEGTDKPILEIEKEYQ